MSGRTSTTITFPFGRIGRPRLRLIHRKTQSSNIHCGRTFIRGRSIASRWGFQMRPTLCSWEVVSTTLPSELGLTAVACETAPHQTDAGAPAARASSSSDLIMVETDANEIVKGSSSLIDFDHGYDERN